MSHKHRIHEKLYQVTHLRADDVHYRETASVKPVVFKVVPVIRMLESTELRSKRLLM